MKNTSYLYISVVSLLLSACGGGGGGSNSGPAATVSTGVFFDSPVSGLRYETPTRSGLTNELGEFEYIDGETVSFYLGNTQLGVTLGTSMVTPFSLFGIAPILAEVEIIDALTSNSVSSYDRSINIAALLQTFDNDGNPDNGIDLGSAHNLLGDNDINLYVKALSFESQADLASAMSIVPQANAITFEDAVKHLYQSLGAEVESALIANFISEVDSKRVESVSYSYDNNGNLITQSTDLNNDGQADVVKTFSYANGNLIQTSNSATNTTESLSYDSNNNLLSRLIDNGQGQNTLESYTYSNNLLSRYDLDRNADGSIESISLYNYDQQGNLQNYEIDKDGDGLAETVATYTYSNGMLVSYVEDTNNDGTANIIIGYSYDGNGNRISQNVSNTQSGMTLSTFEYDQNNNILRYEQDRDLDGIADHIETYSYDQNNNRTFYRRDLNADGVWDLVSQYFYDINNNRTRMIEDSNGNGIVDKVWTGNYQPAILDNGWDLILGKL